MVTQIHSKKKKKCERLKPVQQHDGLLYMLIFAQICWCFLREKPHIQTYFHIFWWSIWVTSLMHGMLWIMGTEGCEEDFWGLIPPKSGRNTLQSLLLQDNLVSRLRRSCSVTLKGHSQKCFTPGWGATVSSSCSFRVSKVKAKHKAKYKHLFFTSACNKYSGGVAEFQSDLKDTWPFHICFLFVNLIHCALFLFDYFQSVITQCGLLSMHALSNAGLLCIHIYSHAIYSHAWSFKSAAAGDWAASSLEQLVSSW